MVYYLRLMFWIGEELAKHEGDLLRILSFRWGDFLMNKTFCLDAKQQRCSGIILHTGSIAELPSVIFELAGEQDK